MVKNRSIFWTGLCLKYGPSGSWSVLSTFSCLKNRHTAPSRIMVRILYQKLSGKQTTFSTTATRSTQCQDLQTEIWSEKCPVHGLRDCLSEGHLQGRIRAWNTDTGGLGRVTQVVERRKRTPPRRAAAAVPGRGDWQVGLTAEQLCHLVRCDDLAVGHSVELLAVEVGFTDHLCRQVRGG